MIKIERITLKVTRSSLAHPRIAPMIPNNRIRKKKKKFRVTIRRIL
jgi:hypothetical protein